MTGKGKAMPSIQDSVRIWQKLASDKLQVMPQRCTRVRNRNTRCQNCVDFCPTGCIAIADNTIDIDPFRCVGCGSCATACPTGALVPRAPSDVQLEQLCTAALDANEGTVVIGCSVMMNRAVDRVDPVKTVPVGCLARVDESLLVDLAGLGAHRAVLVCGDCTTCELNRAGQLALEVVLSTRDILGAWDSPMTVEVAQRFPSSVRLQADHDAARRSFARDARDAALQVAAAAAEQQMESALGAQAAEPFSFSQLRALNGRNLPRFVPARRALLHEALPYLGQAQEAVITTRLWGHAVLDTQACDGCGLCEMFCPTGAIRMVEEGRPAADDADGEEPNGPLDAARVVAVDMFPQRCLQCRACEQICPKQALAIGNQVFTDDIAADRGVRFPLV